MPKQELNFISTHHPIYFFQDFATCFLGDQEIKHIQCRKENDVGLSFIKKGILIPKV